MARVSVLTIAAILCIERLVNLRVVNALAVGDLIGEAVSRVLRTAFLVFSVVLLPADRGVGFSLCDVGRLVFLEIVCLFAVTMAMPV